MFKSTLISFLRHNDFSIKKTGILNTVASTMTVISNEVIPMLDTAIDSADELASIKNNAMLYNMSKITKYKAKSNKDMLVGIRTMFKGFLAAEKDLVKLVNKVIPTVIPSSGARAIDLSVAKVVVDLYGMSNYTLDLLIMILTDPKDTDIPKKRILEIKNSFNDYIESFIVYHKDFDKFVKDIYNVSSVVIKDDSNNSLLDVLLASKGKKLKLPNNEGFINNPIYHIRMWMVDREMEKYEAFKDKKKLIELKLMNLKLDGRGDKTIKKQIEYYEDKLASIESEIKDIEED